jgi:type II secretory pathway pseudopilin PulG
MIRRWQDSRGFALPAVILLVALLTVLLTSGLSRVRTDRQIAEASDETAAALAIAESGLQAYFGTAATRPADGDSTRINVPGGYANVVVHLVRQPADTMRRSLYLVRSTGVAINPDSGAQPRALRTVAQFAEWEAGYLLRQAALTVANGLRKKGGPATLTFNGNDGCGAEPPIPAVWSTNWETGPPNPPPTYEPSPPGMITEGAGTGASIAAQTAIDWAGALGGNLAPDFASFQHGDSTYPIQRVTGDLTLGGAEQSGSGILIVSGDLLLTTDNFSFQGIMLVGGRIDFDAGYHMIRGIVVSGLNEQLGINPQRTEMGGPGKDVDLSYDSCQIQAALARLSGFAPVRNAWFDNWASY